MWPFDDDFGANENWDPGYMAPTDVWEHPYDEMQPPNVRMVPPTRQEYNRPAFERYMEHLQNQPNRADYAPSTGRKILAALAGGLTGLRDPGAGFKLSSSIVETPYNQAMSEWMAGNKDLSNITSAEQDFIESTSRADTERGKLGLGYEKLDAQVGDINRRYQVALKNAKSREEYNEQLAARNQEIAEARRVYNANQAESNRLRSEEIGIRGREAGLEEGRLNLEREKYENPPAKPVGMEDVAKTEDYILREAVHTSPVFQKYFEIDEYGDVVPRVEEWSPEEQQELEMLRTQIQLAARQRLQGAQRIIPPRMRRIP